MRSANLLFLITLLLIVTFGAALQHWRLWPGLAVTEACFILVPAILFARATHSTMVALRLKWVGWKTFLLALLCGAFTLPLAVAAGDLNRNIVGHAFTLPEKLWPLGLSASLTFVLASVILGPGCEEILFRGYILHAYERAGWRPPLSILCVSGLFAVWHLSPTRVLGLVVLSSVFTYLAWRTASVWPAIAAHMGANGTVAVLTIMRVDPPSSDLLWTGMATATALFCFWLVAHDHPAPDVRCPRIGE